METFFTTYNPTSDINIATTYKRIEAGEWTDDREKEIKNFEETVEKLLNTITIDHEHSDILKEFGSGEALRKHTSDAFTYIKSLVHVKAFKVEPIWVIHDIHKLVLSNNYDEKLMWKK